MTRLPESLVSFHDKNFKSITKFPSEMHRSVLPLILVKKEQFKLIGTGFVVNHKMGLVITARHCIEEAFGDMKTRTTPVSEDEGALNFFYLSTQGGKHFSNFLAVRQLYVNDAIDVAIMRTKIPVPKGGNVHDSLISPLALDFSWPQVGTKCLVLGYNKDSSWKPRADDKIIKVGLNLYASQGNIEEVFGETKDSYFQYPLFRLNARVDCGMSGGPVISATTGAVCGIVSKGFNFSSDEEGYVESITHTSGLLPIWVSNDPDNLNAGKSPFYEHVTKQHVNSIGDFSAIKFTQDNKDLYIEYPNGEKLLFKSHFDLPHSDY